MYKRNYRESMEITAKYQKKYDDLVREYNRQNIQNLYLDMKKQRDFFSGQVSHYQKIQSFKKGLCFRKKWGIMGLVRKGTKKSKGGYKNGNGKEDHSQDYDGSGFS